MKKHWIVYVLTILMLVLPSCTGNNAPVITPTVDPTTVAAVVSTMLAGAAPTQLLPEATPTLASTSTPEPQTLLPRSLYYLMQDSNATWQIYRLSRDGATITQITFEPDNVANFDISPADGKVAYIIKDELIIVDTSGQNRQVLIQDPNVVYNLAWSPDGQTIAFGKTDVVLYSLTTGNKETIIPGSERVKYRPVSFSLDGRKLIIRQHFTPGSAESKIHIYDFTAHTLTSLQEESGPYPCFGHIVWNTPDTFFCSSHILAGAVMPGLWRVNANNGSIEPLAGSEVIQSPFRLIAAPHQDAAGNLYYLYAEADSSGHPSAFSFRRSKPDGLTDLVLARPDMFNVLVTLWTPDGTSLLIVQDNGGNNLPTNVLLVPVDSSKPVVTVIPDASMIDSYSLRWGQ